MYHKIINFKTILCQYINFFFTKKKTQQNASTGKNEVTAYQ